LFGQAREWKINLRRPSLSFGEVAVCAENPLGNLYISTEGEVSPCVYINPPLPSPYKRIFQGTEFQLEKVQFGNLFRQPLSRYGMKKDTLNSGMLGSKGRKGFRN
jgi:hypothetical protein